HLHPREQRQDLRHVLEPGPVELQVLARAEVALATVVGAGDVGQGAQLRRVQVAVGRGDAQHRRVGLDVGPVLQAQRAELVLAQLASQVAAGLVSELGDALVHDALVVFVVLVHVCSLCRIRSVFGASSRCGAQCATSLAPTSTSIVARIGRRMRSGTLVEMWLPSQMPGSEPTSRLPSRNQSTLPRNQWPMPAIAVSGTAWAMSEPTMRSAGIAG